MTARRRKGAFALTLLLIAPLAALAQQQEVLQERVAKKAQDASLLDAFTSSGRSLKSAIPIDSQYKRGRDTPLVSNNERAVATFAPAGNKPAVRTPPVKASGPSGSVTSSLEARSLRDWEVEHFVLLATIDGKIHARDRLTGMEELWSFPPPGEEKPVVETIYKRRNDSATHGMHPADDLLWIVEPTQDGALYVYMPGPQAGVHKLGLTMKTLAEELAPYEAEDPPAAYTASKKSTIYKINARNGRLISKFSADGSSTFNLPESCRRPSKSGPFDDDDECKTGGIITIAETEYTVHILDQRSGQECTIVYHQWSPNNRDRDLLRQYSETMDRKYIYPRHDGQILVMDHRTFPEKRVAKSALSSPVVAVFDVARPFDDSQDDVPLIVLPQPTRRIQAYEEVRPANDQSIFVNNTESGSWYAMSEAMYPYVTDGVAEAKCYSFEWSNDFWEGLPPPLALVGKHELSDSQGRRQSIPTIEGPGEVQIALPIPPAEEINVTDQQKRVLRVTGPQPSDFSHLTSTSSLLMYVAFLLLGLIPTLVAIKKRPDIFRTYVQVHTKEEVTIQPFIPQPAEAVIPQLLDASEDQGEERKVRFASSVEEKDVEGEVVTEPLEGDEVNELARMDTNDTVLDDEADGNGDAPEKKKHARGKRGGKKRKKPSKRSGSGSVDASNDSVDRIINEVKDMAIGGYLQPDEETVDGDITDVSGVKKIQNLTINTNNVLGHGSGGTFVFEGNFEGRDVAVKRMLPQYFELASQEVSLLQQSDDHPNVIRYYCQQRDANFLYIAVEKCQASLWDLYKEGLTIDVLPDERKALVSQINLDPTKALYQLAAGLNHLHSLRIIHRDIKPQNILIAYPKKNQIGAPRFVISDFGLCKTLPDNMSTIAGTQGIAGTVGWKAPELITQPKEGNGRQSSSGEHSSTGEGAAQGFKRSVDIFSLGCVFFYVLTNGYHPFDDDEGWAQIRELNIKKNNMNLKRLDALGDDGQEPWHLINWMLQPEPKDRPTAQQVVRHPFFWSPKQRLDFLCDVSDHWERECRDPPSEDLLALEARGKSVIPKGNFLALLDYKFIETLGKQRKYTGDRMLDLLRALRNKKNHYADMPDDVKQRVGALPDGYLRYWTNRFPTLLIACYEVVRECGLEEDDRFKGYFQGL